MPLTRRGLFKLSVGSAAGLAAIYTETQLAFLQAAPGITNPLAQDPDRGWEKTYRDQYKYDSSFTFVCAPNCTHNCRLRAFVRNGIVMRTEQNYDGQSIGDLQGNKSSNAWNPRGCN
ncbi:MAG: nitrate oxidoreductase subunit alpha, partial [Gemmataceae bacterium]|nr:nitrate oxidoreductase subunit alpha [Gemmataceae bacterium]